MWHVWKFRTQIKINSKVIILRNGKGKIILPTVATNSTKSPKISLMESHLAYPRKTLKFYQMYKTGTEKIETHIMFSDEKI